MYLGRYSASYGGRNLLNRFVGASVCQVGKAPSWLVGWFGFNGPLRQYFSLYRAVFQREGKQERKDR